MKKYFSVVSASYLYSSIYKNDMILRAVTGILMLIIQVAIWKSLYKGNSSNISESFQLTEIVTYSVLSTIISIFINSSVVFKIHRRYQTGELASDLLKPIDFQLFYLFDKLGIDFYNLIYSLIPTILFSIFMWGIIWNGISKLLIFIIFVCISLIMHFYINYIFGLIAIKYIDIWHIGRLLDLLTKFFAGAVIPLSFFPAIIEKIINLLPFHFIYFTPISIYLGKVSQQDIIKNMILLIAWTFMLKILCNIAEKRVLKLISIQGG